MKFLFPNVELNLPHHLSYVAALPCKSTQRIMLTQCIRVQPIIAARGTRQTDTARHFIVPLRLEFDTQRHKN